MPNVRIAAACDIAHATLNVGIEGFPIELSLVAGFVSKEGSISALVFFFTVI